MSGRTKFRLTGATIAALVVGANTPLINAQSKMLPQIFEVASVKPAPIPLGGEGGNRSRIEHTPNSLTMLNVGLSDCVQWAYGVAFFQVSAAHVGADSYDILA